VITYSIVYRDPEKYCTFPSIISLGVNRLLLSFREAGKWSVRAAKENRVVHQATDSTCYVISSEDGGRTWKKETKNQVYHGKYGINDAALTRLKNGELLLRLNEIEVRRSPERNKLKGPFVTHRPDLKTVSGSIGQLLFRSKDDGKNWSPPDRMDLGQLNYGFSRDPIVELEDGTLVLSVYEGAPFRREQVWLVRSWDQGKSWQDKSLISDDNSSPSEKYGINYNETAIIPISDQKLLALIRSDSSYYTEGENMIVGGIGQLSYAFSDNAGLTWSPPQVSGIWGQPAHLLRLQDGRLLCTYGYRRKPYGIRACLSENEGQSWKTNMEVIIKNGAQSWDLGYPMSAQCSDGTIVTAYYWNDDKKIRYIETARWKVEEFL
jgi:sialidase-1